MAIVWNRSELTVYGRARHGQTWLQWGHAPNLTYRLAIRMRKQYTVCRQHKGDCVGTKRSKQDGWRKPSSPKERDRVRHRDTRPRRHYSIDYKKILGNDVRPAISVSTHGVFKCSCVRIVLFVSQRPPRCAYSLSAWADHKNEFMGQYYNAGSGG